MTKHHYGETTLKKSNNIFFNLWSWYLNKGNFFIISKKKKKAMWVVQGLKMDSTDLEWEE